jgi:hypothetical protein
MKDKYLTPSQKLESLADAAFKATKSLALSDAIQARYTEGLEAVQDLPKEEKAQYLAMVRGLLHDRIKAYADAFGTLTDFLKMADDCPDFVMKEHQESVEKVRVRHGEMLEELKSIQHRLGNL